MKKVLFDNWSMQDIASSLYDGSSQISEEYGRLLTGLVLWDKVCYPQNDNSQFWLEYCPKLGSILQPIDDTFGEFSMETYEIYQQKFSNESKVVAQGALRYIRLCEKWQCDYMPSGKRVEFLNEFEVENYVDKITRYENLITVDNGINELYEELYRKRNKKFIGMKYPILVDYIVQNVPEDMSYFEYALELRNEKSVKGYRKVMDEFDEAIQKSDWQEAISISNYIDEVVEKMGNKTSQKILSANVDVFPLPNLSISGEIPILFRKYNMMFVQELCNFALKRRHK